MVYGDQSLDESGWLPEALKRVHKACTRSSYRGAVAELRDWELEVSKSQLGRLGQTLDKSQQSLTQQYLHKASQQPLQERKKKHKRWWCIEVDGCFVPTAVEGGTDWKEVKSAVIYPMHCPSERHYVSGLCSKEEFAPLVHGLLRVAGVKQDDLLIGISDGAVWIAELMGDLGVWRHILDVYHVSSYMETLMVGLAWDQPLRDQTRATLLRGELDLQQWLNHLSPTLNTKTLDEPSRKALAYLQKQALLEHTAYPRFKAEGILVIGSGQIEAANKQLIAQRLDRSGCRWKEPGANAKALVRAQFFSTSPIIPFEQVRHNAFPIAA